MFFLVYLLVFAALILISWTPIAQNKIGMTEIVPAIWKSAKKVLSFDGNGLTIIAFAFLLYAILQSKTFEALFASKRKWLQKRRFATIAIITIFTSFLASTLWWADEFIHFYPLLVPLLLTMGFDAISAVLCLWGGTIVGVIGSIATENHGGVFKQCVNDPASTHFNGTEGLWFRIITWVILTTILVFFNIWYCNKVQKKLTSLPAKEALPEKIPAFNWKRKLVLIFSFFFILVSVFGSIGWFAKETGPIPEQICSKEEVEDYKELGTVKVSPDSSSEKNEIEIAEVKKSKKTSWGKFGEWEDAQKTYWFTIGGIVICLIAKLNIINTLTAAITKVIPIIIMYIFAYTAPMLLKAMKLKISSTGFSLVSRHTILPIIFVVFFVLCFFGLNIMRSALPIVAKTLKSFSANTLAYSVTVMFMGRFLANAVSPIDNNLQMTLQTNKLTYKKYIKKTWILWTIIFFVLLILIAALPFFIDRGSG